MLVIHGKEWGKDEISGSINIAIFNKLKENIFKQKYGSGDSQPSV